ncbi:MAG: zinc ribbon domain-containing protein [Spirochaetales bacterium]|nr:zinc ribbon domain-containing protein [Spirochaetales bacterium]
MPIYEYVCTECSHNFDVLVREGNTLSCPQCSGTKLEKKFSMFAAHSGAGTDQPGCAGTCPGFSRGSCGSGLCQPE